MESQVWSGENEYTVKLSECIKNTHLNMIFNTYPMKQPGLYYFEAIKMKSHSLVKFCMKETFTVSKLDRSGCFEESLGAAERQKTRQALP